MFPNALMQREDFKQHNPIALLDRYRMRIPCFKVEMFPVLFAIGRTPGWLA